MVKHKLGKSGKPTVLDELKNKIPKVEGIVTIERNENIDSVKVTYTDSPTDAEKTDVEDILKKRGLMK